MTPEVPNPVPLSRAASDALARRRRGRNLALLAVLLAVAVLFYFIAIVRLGHPGLGSPP